MIPPEKRRIRIIIAENNPLIRGGQAVLIEREKDCIIADAVENGKELVTSYRKNNPDIIISNIILPQLNGLEAFEEILNRDKYAKILFTSNFRDEAFLHLAFRYRGSGYLCNLENKGMILDLIRKIHSGKFCFPDEINSARNRQTGINEFTGYENRKLRNTLSKREFLIFCMYGKGLSSKEIADKLWISNKTVEFHLYKMRLKLNLQNRIKLLTIAARHVMLYSMDSSIR